MVHNETLQRHEDCLEQCEIEHDDCQLDRSTEEDCATRIKICSRDCDFDFGP